MILADQVLFLQGEPIPLGGRPCPPGHGLGGGLLQGGVHRLGGDGQLLARAVAGLEGLACELHLAGQVGKDTAHLPMSPWACFRILPSGPCMHLSAHTALPTIDCL